MADRGIAPIDHKLLPPVAFTRDQRERLAIRRSLAHAFHPAPPARHGRHAPPGGSALVARRGTSADPIVAGFFVDWADNSLASLIQHVGDLDWVICEWSFLNPAGDSIDTPNEKALLTAIAAEGQQRFGTNRREAGCTYRGRRSPNRP